ncbi:MAG: TrmH family RNA methyltransferase [Bacillales bacterium]
MEYKKYNKKLDYSYTYGSFVTFELLNNHYDKVKEIYIKKNLKNKDIIDKLSIYPNLIIKEDDKIFNKLQDKDNCYLLGVFNKYNTYLDNEKNHLLLDNPSNMGNLGTIIRSALGFNIKNIALIKPALDYFDPKVIRSSMGAIFNVNIEYFDSLEDYKTKYNKHKIYSFMLQTNNKLKNTKFNKENLTTLAFGNEASGLPIKYLDSNSIRIEHSDKIDSLNITNAVSIALYEFNKQVS